MKIPEHISEAEFYAWFNGRPKCVQDAIERCPPWNEYRLKETGQTGLIHSYEENDGGPVTAKFDTYPRWPMVVGHRVFGVSLDSLEVVEPQT